MPAGAAVLNGAGELTGLPADVRMGRARDARLPHRHDAGRPRATTAPSTRRSPRMPRSASTTSCMPVVGECDDSWLNDARTVQVDADGRGARAVAAATAGPVAQGAVGAGTGMITLGWKGGIGTSSRVARGRSDGRRAGALELRLRARAPRRRRAGRRDARAAATSPSPGRELHRRRRHGRPAAAAQLQRVARRCGLGLARTGCVAYHGTGEIFLAFSTEGGRPREREPRDGSMRPGSASGRAVPATVEATEEAVLNAMWAAVDIDGRDGRVARALPHDEVIARSSRRRQRRHASAAARAFASVDASDAACRNASRPR